MNFKTWRVAGLVLAVTGCGGGGEQQLLGEATETQALYMTGDGWWNFTTPNVIPICWKNRLFPQLINPIEEAIHEWDSNSGISVTAIPFPDCPSSTPNQASIGFVADPSECNDSDGIDGGSSIGMTGSLNNSAVSYRFSMKARVCPDTGYDTNTGLKTGTGGARVFGRHEFGHILGFSHEQDRPENADGHLCSTSVNTVDGGVELTDFDVDSVMSYCHSQAGLTPSDIAGLQAAYMFDKSWSKPSRNFCTASSRKIAVGDFNGDGADDLLCVDNATGDMSVDLVNQWGEFNGDDWTSPARNFCLGSGSVLLTGSTRGNGHADLICVNRVSGVVQTDRASSTGTFTGVDWSTTRNFCMASGSKIAAGDFNGDGRVDLLCIEPGGKMSVDLANANGEYWSDDWSDPSRNFCRFSNETLLIGDVNGDGRDDLVCNNSGGGLYVDRASSTGAFTGSDWSATRNYCLGSGDRGFLMDINGDGRKDYVCWNRTTGFMQADLANNYGEFWSTNWQGPFSAWCTGTDKSMVSGSFDTWGAQDMLCVSTSGALKAEYSVLPL